MSIRPASGSQPSAPRGGQDVDPRIVLLAAVVFGSLAAYFADWPTAFQTFSIVISLFTPRSRPPNCG